MQNQSSNMTVMPTESEKPFDFSAKDEVLQKIQKQQLQKASTFELFDLIIESYNLENEGKEPYWEKVKEFLRNILLIDKDYVKIELTKNIFIKFGAESNMMKKTLNMIDEVHDTLPYENFVDKSEQLNHNKPRGSESYDFPRKGTSPALFSNPLIKAKINFSEIFTDFNKDGMVYYNKNDMKITKSNANWRNTKSAITTPRRLPAQTPSIKLPFEQNPIKKDFVVTGNRNHVSTDKLDKTVDSKKDRSNDKIKTDQSFEISVNLNENIKDIKSDRSMKNFHSFMNTQELEFNQERGNTSNNFTKIILQKEEFSPVPKKTPKQNLDRTVENYYTKAKLDHNYEKMQNFWANNSNSRPNKTQKAIKNNILQQVQNAKSQSQLSNKILHQLDKIEQESDFASTHKDIQHPPFSKQQ